MYYLQCVQRFKPQIQNVHVKWYTFLHPHSHKLENFYYLSLITVSPLLKILCWVNFTAQTECIDLTSEEDIIDLTSPIRHHATQSVNDSPVIVSGFIEMKISE